jgi:hypothetical protein
MPTPETESAGKCQTKGEWQHFQQGFRVFVNNPNDNKKPTPFFEAWVLGEF